MLLIFIIQNLPTHQNHVSILSICFLRYFWTPSHSQALGWAPGTRLPLLRALQVGQDAEHLLSRISFTQKSLWGKPWLPDENTEWITFQVMHLMRCTAGLQAWLSTLWKQSPAPQAQRLKATRNFTIIRSRVTSAEGIWNRGLESQRWPWISLLGWGTHQAKDGTVYTTEEQQIGKAQWCEEPCRHWNWLAGQLGDVCTRNRGPTWKWRC